MLALAGAWLMVGGRPGPYGLDELIALFGLLIVLLSLALFLHDWFSLGKSHRGMLICSCGYDLRGTIRAGRQQCPECGKPIGVGS